jgi:MarR family transcriptional regulator, multiple antibiotic resistance protein MarR
MPDIYDVKTFEPKNALGYLIGHTRKALLEEIDRELASLDLTAAQYIILSSLNHLQVATAADLCNGIVYDPGAMTRLIDRLELKGFVRRQRQPGDRRRVDLELTTEGKSLYPRMNAIVVRVLNRFLAGFTKKEARELEQYLRRIRTNAKLEKPVSMETDQ